jgi:ATP-dependent protease HslVU (ClpYQ) peptidase subunit
MTTLVGIQGEGFAILACDSLVLGSDGSKIYRLPEDYAKFAVHGKVAVGAAGSARAINLLKNAWVAPQPNAGVKLDDWVESVLVPNLKALFKDHGIKKKDEVTMLVAVRGQIYEIDKDFCWARDSSGYYSVGSGSSYALGVLHAIGTKDFSAAQRALEIAIFLDNGTSEPVRVFRQNASGKVT